MTDKYIENHSDDIIHHEKDIEDMLTENQTRYIFETNTILFEGNTIAKVDYMLDVADKKLTEKMIREFHKKLKEGTSDSRLNWFNVGEYKRRANVIGSKTL